MGLVSKRLGTCQTLKLDSNYAYLVSPNQEDKSSKLKLQSSQKPHITYLKYSSEMQYQMFSKSTGIEAMNFKQVI